MITVTEIKQMDPITASIANVQIQFSIHGTVPDIVEAHAQIGVDAWVLAGQIKVNSHENNYKFPIELVAGVIFTIYVCPRTSGYKRES